MEWAPSIDSRSILEHAPIIGSDGRSLGVVAAVEADLIRLSSVDPAAGGVPRWLPLATVAAVEDGQVRLAISAAQAGEALLDPPRMAARTAQFAPPAATLPSSLPI